MRTGSRGEDVAARHITLGGYAVLERNVRFAKDEIDIVAFDPFDGVMVFVEVKARTRAHDDYRPELNITPSKRRKLARSARAWVAAHDYDGGWRIDVVCVVAGNVVSHLREINH